MNGDIPDDLIAIDDPEVDPERIMDEIRARIHRRRQEFEAVDVHYPTFGAAAYPGEPEEGPFDADLYYHLRRANEAYLQVGVEPVLADSPATRLPLVGPLWARVRREAHNLVLFYLGELARQQGGVNRHLVSVLNRMAVQLREQEAELRALRKDVSTLER
jgi:hypothetical protein